MIIHCHFPITYCVLPTWLCGVVLLLTTTNSHDLRLKSHEHLMNQVSSRLHRFTLFHTNRSIKGCVVSYLRLYLSHGSFLLEATLIIDDWPADATIPLPSIISETVTSVSRQKTTPFLLTTNNNIQYIKYKHAFLLLRPQLLDVYRLACTTFVIAPCTQLGVIPRVVLAYAATHHHHLDISTIDSHRIDQ